MAPTTGGRRSLSIETPAGNVFVYFGDEPNTITETTGVNGSGINLLTLTDLRFDTSQLTGGSFYDTWAHAQALVGSQPVSAADLVLDGGWGGDQVLNLTSASVAGNSFTFPAAGTAVQTNSAPAWITINRVSGTPGPIDESTLTSTQGDTGGRFRQVDGKYIYNLPVSDLSGGTGDNYNVGITFTQGGSPVPAVAHFGLK